jgi:hypothetical protein
MFLTVNQRPQSVVREVILSGHPAAEERGSTGGAEERG